MSLKRIRKEKGMKQEFIAEQIGVRQSTVAMWETGKSMPRGETMIKLAKLLNCTIDDLLRQESEGAPVEHAG